MAAEGCLGFVMEFNTYNIIGDEAYVVYLSLACSTLTRGSTGLRPDAAIIICGQSPQQSPQQYWNAIMGICLAHGQTLAKC